MTAHGLRQTALRRGGRRTIVSCSIAAAVLLAAGLLIHGALPGSSGGRAPLVHESLASSVPAATERDAHPGAGVPKLRIPVSELSIYPGRKSMANELDAEHLREVDSIDRSVRQKAFAKAELTTDEVEKSDVIYRDADQKWLEAERQRDESTGLLSADAIDKMHAADRNVTIELMHALGAAKAGRIRISERMAYRQFIQDQHRQREAPPPFAVRLAGRRLEIQQRLPAAL